MMTIYQQYLDSGVQPCTVQDIWERLDDYFDLQTLDEMDYNTDDDDNITSTKDTESVASSQEAQPKMTTVSPYHPEFWKYSRDFELPWDEYEPIIAEHRKDHSSTSAEATPASTPAASTPSHRLLRTRKGSPVPSTESSRAVSPEVDRDAPISKKTRRTTSGSRKEVPTSLSDSRPSTPMLRRKSSRNVLPSPTIAKGSPSVTTRRAARKH
ncbi:hypothetical protein IWQ61_005515 [Dispira simplex]|nr:hypothetical protein IWQ61_005515 [Dispira simplex]